MTVDQQHNGGQWYLLGRYTLDANSQVSLPGQTDGYTVADALQLESTSAPSQIDYLHPDHLGTVRAITDASQTVIWRWDSAPFGDTLPDEDPDGDGQALTFNLRFPGQFFDAETGLHYNYFRDYDPATGRYVQSDPIGLDGGINTYAYVSGNPLLYFDEKGLFGTKPTPPDEQAENQASACFTALAGRVAGGSCPSYSDCLVCCGEALGRLPISYQSSAIAICTVLCDETAERECRKNASCDFPINKG